MSDYPEWSALRMRSRSFLEPWEPRWSESDLTRDAFRRLLERHEADRDSGLAMPLFLFPKGSERLAGGLTIGNIRRGSAESCTLGYWLGEPYSKRGLMGDAVSAVIPQVFGPMRLHRIEAACIPDNERSMRLLERAGFRREGYLNGYLKINGAWRDHLLYALIEEDWRMAQARLAKAAG